MKNKISTNDINSNAKYIINRLQEHGFEAFVVGGCVRDLLMGKTPKDWDLTTNAKPNDVIRIFDRTIPTGLEHGTVTVLIDGETFEVTTFRIDGEYKDMRRPESVSFSNNIIDDLSRRDFTVNAMAYNDEHGLIDEFGGVEDISKGVIRCVGEAEKRFEEDALRIMRAIRFSAKLGYRIESTTYEAMKIKSENLKEISIERVNSELEEIFEKDITKLDILNKLGLCEYFFDKVFSLEELVKALKVNSNNAKRAFLYMSDETIKLKKIMKKLRYSNKDVDEATKIHILINTYEDFIESESIRVWLKKMMNFSGVDIVKKSLPIIFMGEKEAFFGKNINVQVCFDEISGIIEAGECFSISQLKLNGKDLIENNIAKGRELGMILEYLNDQVIHHPELNEKEKLLKISIQYNLEMEDF